MDYKQLKNGSGLCGSPVFPTKASPAHKATTRGRRLLVGNRAKFDYMVGQFNHIELDRQRHNADFLPKLWVAARAEMCLVVERADCRGRASEGSGRPSYV